MTGRGERVAVVAGASGFIGRAVVRALEEDGYSVQRIGRSEAVRWDDPGAVAAAVDDADVLINLAGKSVDCRYTDANRDEILRSRLDTTRQLREAVAGAVHPPRVWLNASTATIYRHSTDRPNTESDGRIGTGFSVDVAKAWEREFFAGELPETRRVALRMAIVLGDGPATAMLFRLARLGLGGPHIDGWSPPHRRYRGIGAHPTGMGRDPWYRTGGRQRFSWIHLDDVVGVIRFLIDRTELHGPINLCSPNPSDDRSLMMGIRRILRAPFGLPAWKWMLWPAMAILRTEPELVLKSRWVLPAALERAGYAFRRPELDDALRACAADHRSPAESRDDRNGTAR